MVGCGWGKKINEKKKRKKRWERWLASWLGTAVGWWNNYSNGRQAGTGTVPVLKTGSYRRTRYRYAKLVGARVVGC